MDSGPPIDQPNRNFVLFFLHLRMGYWLLQLYKPHMFDHYYIDSLEFGWGFHSVSASEYESSLSWFSLSSGRRLSLKQAAMRMDKWIPCLQYSSNFEKVRCFQRIMRKAFCYSPSAKSSVFLDSVNAQNGAILRGVHSLNWQRLFRYWKLENEAEDLLCYWLHQWPSVGKFVPTAISVCDSDVSRWRNVFIRKCVQSNLWAFHSDCCQILWRPSTCL